MKIRSENRKKTLIWFAVTFAIVMACLAAGVIKTVEYNRAEHFESFTGSNLFYAENASKGRVSVSAVPRGSTWTKLFDLKNEGLTENNYQAYTYDFTVTNDTKDEVSGSKFKLTFSNDVFLASAWNGSLWSCSKKA